MSSDLETKVEKQEAVQADEGERRGHYWNDKKTDHSEGQEDGQYERGPKVDFLPTLAREDCLRSTLVDRSRGLQVGLMHGLDLGLAFSGSSSDSGVGGALRPEANSMQLPEEHRRAP